MAAASDQARDVESEAKIFISYSRKDMAFADQLEAALKARGFEPLIDRTEIYAFEDWWKRLEALMRGADTVVFVLSPDSVVSHEALKEVAYAGSLNKRFAPIVSKRVEDSLVPKALRRLNFIFFDDQTGFESSADQLAEALRTDIVWIREHTEFGEAARNWVAAGRPSGLLLRTPSLEMAEHWIGTRPSGAPEPTHEICEFVAASRHGARSAQQLRRIVEASMFTLLVVIIIGLIGWINEGRLKAQWRWYRTVRPFVAANIQPYVLSAPIERELKPKDSFRECVEQGHDYCPQMIVVPAGSFMMGASPTEKGRDLDEGPQHKVTIVKPFAVSEFDLTFDEWDTCVAYGDCAEGVSDAGWGRGRLPVINVSWDDAQHYVAWLSKMTGKSYRLLSEAEYEYAARGGTQTAYPWGDVIQLNGMAMANCNGCGSKWGNLQTAPVGSFAANGFGLYDMVGNVWKWVLDCYHPSYAVGTPQGNVDAPADGSEWIAGCPGNGRHVVRGASWYARPESIRSAFRDWNSTGVRDDLVGFRIGRTLITR
jgi:formylglycine-generating enzyme required for sulfatase activity